MGVVKDMVGSLVGMESRSQKAMRKAAEEQARQFERETNQLEAQTRLESQNAAEDVVRIESGAGGDAELYLGGAKKKRSNTASQTLGLGGL